MANKTIAQLTAGTALTTSLIEMDDGAGGSFKLTLAQVLALVPSVAAILVETGAAAKISALASAGALAGTESIPVTQGGATKKATALDIATLASTTQSIINAIMVGNAPTLTLRSGVPTTMTINPDVSGNWTFITAANYSFQSASSSFYAPSTGAYFNVNPDGSISSYSTASSQLHLNIDGTASLFGSDGVGLTIASNGSGSFPDGFSGSGTFTNFTIVGGIITNAT